MSNKITVALMRDLEKQVANEEISYSRMVEILNQKTRPTELINAVLLLKKSWIYDNEFSGTDVDEILTKAVNKYERN